jgi:hypothetical protein
VPFPFLFVCASLLGDRENAFDWHDAVFEEMAGRHPTRLSKLIKQGRLKGDYIDNEGFHYWTHAGAERIVKIIKDYEKRSKGRKETAIDFESARKKGRKGK